MSAPRPSPPAKLPTQARRARVAALAQRGLRPHQIAYLLGVARGTVQRDIAKLKREDHR